MADAADASERAIEAILARTLADYRRRKAGSSLRPETLLQIETDWHKVPTAGCLGLTIHRDRRNLLITDLRIAMSVIGNSDWAVGRKEAGINVVKITFEISPKRPAYAAPIIANFNLLALARRFQKGFGTTDEEILADVGRLAAVAPSLILAASGTPFSVPAASGGEWRGRVGPFRSMRGVEAPAALVRTFVSYPQEQCDDRDDE